MRNTNYSNSGTFQQYRMPESRGGSRAGARMPAAMREADMLNQGPVSRGNAADSTFDIDKFAAKLDAFPSLPEVSNIK